MKTRRRLEIFPNEKLAKASIDEFYNKNLEDISFYDRVLKTLLYKDTYIGFRTESYSTRLDGLTFNEIYIHPDCKYRSSYIPQVIRNKAKIVYKV